MIQRSESMSRPCKRRRICEEPKWDRFIPDLESLKYKDGKKEVVYMTLDEYETIRLIDFCDMTQVECAVHMQVARTTVQAIYGNARKKLADCLVNGKELTIQGGDYELCSGDVTGCERNCRYRQMPDSSMRRMEETDMRIAVTYDNGQIFQHFGHTEFFKIYDVENGEIVAARVVDSAGSGHGALAGVLYQLQVDALICGGIGGGARNALGSVGIQIYGGVSGDADAAAAALAKGALTFDPNARCSHHGEGHGHGEGHSCGGHDHGEGHTCGSHGCGGGHHCG